MARRLLRLLDGMLNTLVLAAILLLFLYGCYGLWDSHMVYEAADQTQYEAYKPTQDGPSFEELQSRNPDVLGWLQVYGTGIDHPLVQGADNDAYLNTSVTGEFALSGSIFLDCKSSKDFSDFNSIIYGHHMEKSAMFGDIGRFAEKGYFDSHPYGSLYYGGKDHGLEFFAFLSVDAYDTGVYRSAVTGADAQQAYLDGLLEKAVQKRDLPVSTEDRLVLLSTCDSQTTSGRHVLAGRITEQVQANPFLEEEQEAEKKTGTISQGKNWIMQMPAWVWAVILLLLLAVILGIWKHKKKKQKMGEQTDGKTKKTNRQ